MKKLVKSMKKMISYFGATCFGIFICVAIVYGMNWEVILGMVLSLVVAISAAIGAKEDEEEETEEENDDEE